MKIEPWVYTVDLSRVESANSLQKHHQVPSEDLELEATDYRELPESSAGDRPYYEQHYSRYRGFVGALSGLLILIGICLTVGAVSGTVQHHLQQQGGDTSVRR